MNVSSRTPEGEPFRCSICRKMFCLTVSTFPWRDVTCPHCGCLVFEAHGLPATASQGSFGPSPWIRVATQVIEIIHTALWLSYGIATCLIIHFHDGTWLPSLFWLVALPTYGLLILPRIEASFGNLPDYGKTFWLGVGLGWSLVAGVPTGVLFGALIPLVDTLDWSANTGACAGLLFGPLMAATLGLTLVGTFNFCLWLATGRTLSEKQT